MFERPDVLQIAEVVVLPAARDVFRAHEVESLVVSWEDPVTLQDGTTSRPTVLNVRVVVAGEEHVSNLWTIGMTEQQALENTETLADEFRTFVAESIFGWGEQR